MTAPRRPAPSPGRPPLRLTVVPTPQPPLEPRPALRLVHPGRPVPRPAPRPGPRPGAALPAGPNDGFGPVLSGRADLPPAGETARRLVTSTLEALTGRRPLAQLQPLTSPGVYAALSAGRRPRWCGEGGAPVIVGRIRVCEPVDGVAEVSAVAHRSGRAHAVAARLEGIDGRWRCTALQIG
jgi:hypothetical protein